MDFLKIPFLRRIIIHGKIKIRTADLGTVREGSFKDGRYNSKTQTIHASIPIVAPNGDKRSVEFSGQLRWDRIFGTLKVDGEAAKFPASFDLRKNGGKCSLEELRKSKIEFTETTGLAQHYQGDFISSKTQVHWRASVEISNERLPADQAFLSFFMGVQYLVAVMSLEQVSIPVSFPIIHAGWNFRAKTLTGEIVSNDAQSRRGLSCEKSKTSPADETLTCSFISQADPLDGSLKPVTKLMP